ncbi:MAG: histidinol-phosphatase [Rhodospirillales bacterium]
MTEPDMGALKAFAEELTRQAMQTVLAQQANAQTEIKPDGSPVTTVDRAVEQVLRASIARHYPDHGILGEEFGPHNLEADWVWVLDPIDGTRHFVSGLPTFGVLIALCHRQSPLLGVICQPQIGDVYLGIVGQGSWLNGKALQVDPVGDLSGAIANLSDPETYDETTRARVEALSRRTRWNVYDGGCLGYGALAAGRLHLCVSGTNLDSYDLCALVPVVEGAGGLITDWQGKALGLASSGAIAASASPALHEQVLTALNG